MHRAEHARLPAAMVWWIGFAAAGSVGALFIDQPAVLNLTVLLLGVVVVVACVEKLGDPAWRYDARMWVPAVMVWYFVAGTVQLRISPQSDTLGYFETASALSGHGGEAGDVFLVSGKEGFVRLLSVVFRLGSPDMGTPIAVNAVLIGLTVVVSMKATTLLLSGTEARTIPAVFAFFPPLLVWGSQGLREAGVFLGISLMVLAAAHLQKSFTVGGIAGLALATAFLFVFRGGIAVVVLGGVLVGLALSRRGFRGSTGPLLIVVPGAALAAYASQTVPYFNDIQRSYFDAERQAVVRDSLSQANSGFEQSLSGPLGLLASMARVVMGPYPWEWLTYPVAVPDVLAWLVAGVLVLRTFRTARSPFLLLAGPALAIAVAIALGVTNYGMLLRVRAMIVVVLVPLLAHALAGRRSAEAGAGRRSREAAAA